jgi:hypothetical protein
MANNIAGESVCQLVLRTLAALLLLLTLALSVSAQSPSFPQPSFPDDVPADFASIYGSGSYFNPGKDGQKLAIIAGLTLGSGGGGLVGAIAMANAWVPPDPAPPSLGGTPLYFPYLVRQANCSLTRYVADSTGTIVETDANFQDSIHKAELVTTTGDTFPNGCLDPSTGIASQIFSVVAQPANGNVALAYISLDGVTVVIHDNTGAIVSQMDYPTVTSGSGGVVFGLAAADLNGDHNTDIVVATQTGPGTGSLSVFLGDGTGNFTPGQIIAIAMPVASAGLGVTIDDLNGDGHQDLIAVTASDGTTSGVTAFLGNGDGTFPASGISGPASAGGQVAVTADFNGDGKKDIATSYGNILLGDGTGNFRLATQSVPVGQLRGLAAADFNHDGKADLAFADSDAAIIDVYFGNGDGTFTYSASYPTMYGAQSIEATDLDGDGYPDLFVGTAEGGFYWSDLNTQSFFSDHLNRGDGTFGPSQTYLPSAYAATTFQGILNTYYDVADFDGDHKPDLLTFDVEAGGASLSVLKGNGDGTFNRAGILSPVSGFTVPGSIILLMTADVIGDKNADAIFAWDSGTGGSHISVALGDGHGSFGAQTDYLVSPIISAGAMADINGDGKPDIVFIGAATAGAPASTGLYVMLNNGDGTFTASQLALVNAKPNMSFLAVADVNGDGHPDIVVTTAGDPSTKPATPGKAYLYLGKGDGTFMAPATLSPGSFSPGPVAIADVNGDGRPDLIFAGTNVTLLDGNLTTQLGNGDGTFQAPQTVAQPNAFPTGIVVADLNGDSKPDVILGGCCGLAFSYLTLGNGDGTFGDANSGFAGNIFVGISSTQLKLADLNGDGLPDLLLVSNDAFIETFLSHANPVTISPTTTTLMSSASTITAGQSVTFTANVAPQSGTGAPSGSVNFLDGATVIGSGVLSNAGVATFSTSSLAVGAHMITAAYQADPNFAVSTSSAVTVQVNM